MESLARNGVQHNGPSHILSRLGSVTKDISFIGRIEEAHRRLEKLSTLGNNPSRSEIRQAVEGVSDVLNEVKTLITEGERAGNSGHENEVPFRVLSEAAADAIISIDDQSTIRYVNPAAGRMFGYQPAEMVGQNLTCLMPEHLRQSHLSSVSRYISQGERHIDWVAVELTGLHKTGQEFPIEVSFAEDIRNGRHCFTGFVRDVTARKRSEEALRASEGRLQDILDNSTAVVYVKDLELRYVLVNREYERKFRVQRDHIRGKTAFDIHPRHVAESIHANDRQVIEAGSPIQYEAAIPTAEGERHYVVVKFLLQGYAQNPYAICGIATDITELKRAEELQARRARQAALRADIHAAFSVGTEGALPIMLQRSAEAIVGHLDAAFARIWTLDDRQNMLELQASAGLYTRLDGEHARVAVGNLKIGRIAQERRPHLTNDLQNDERLSHPEWAKQEGMVAFAGYPLQVEGRLVGVLAMFARKQLTQDTLESLEVVADAVAQGIERKRAEETLARLNRTLKTLYQCNQALVRATEEYELLRSVCRILVEVGGLRMAWVGYKVFDEEKTVQPVAQAGYEDGYLERINITWADSERGRGPTGTAIRTGAVSSNKDILTDPQMAPWRTEALRRGYASSIALPLMSGGESFGALTLYAEERDVFNESTVKQYADLANNLAYGVIALRTREERARSEEALRASEGRLQDIIDNTTSIIFVKDLEFRYLMVNREYERRHKVRREEIRGKSDFDIHPQAVAETLRANDRQVIEAGEPVEFEESVPSDGSDRHYVVVKFLLRDRADKPYAVCGIATDITALKRAEELQKDLRTREAELAHATRVMTMGEVAGSIAHEVNQPLGAIINYANACLRILKSGSGDLMGVTTALSAVVKDAERAAAVIARVRALAKKSPPEMAAVEVSEIISDVVALVRRELTECRIELITELYSDLPPILGDRVQLQQVLLNLIMNSIEAMREVGDDQRNLFIGARSHVQEDKRFVLITVRDSGVGLKSGQISRLFETFYTTKADGMGMGLAISRSIIEGHGGRLWAKPNAGQGAIFQFTLPTET